jgi:hypothetical protein
LDEREKAKAFARYFKEIEDRLAALERPNQLNYASIEGGALDIYDEDGTLKGSVGVQADGGVAVVPDPLNTLPPPTPTAPTVEPALAGLIIGWDGLWDDAEAPPSDFSLIQVHVGTAADFTPDAATQIATITDVTGGTATVHIEGYALVWVRLVAANTAALVGEPSTAVQGQPRQAVGQDLIDGIITDVKLAEEAVTAAKLAAEAVTSDKVKPGSINEVLLANDAVTAAKLAAGAVGTTALADGAVLSEKLAANAVTQSKLANGAVTELALADQAVTGAKVAVAAIDSAKIADAAVTAAKIGQAAVTAGKIADQAVTALALADQAVTAAKVAALAIDSTKIADAAVTAAKIGQAAVTAGKIAAQAVSMTALTGALADTASQRWVDSMGDPTAWTVTQTGTGATWSYLTGVTDATTGGDVGEARGFIRIRGNTQLAYDPDVLYRIAARVRATSQPATADVVYVGALGIGADGVTLVNRDGANSPTSQYYVAASGKTVATADGWVTVIGYLKGRALTGSSGSAGPNNDPRSPGVVHADTKYIAPYVWLNFNNQASVAGTFQVDVVSIEALKTGVVDSTNLVAGSVTTAAIATDAVTATQIAAGAVSTSELAAGAVTTAKLAAGSVTANEIAASTITSGQLAANSVTATQLAANSVQTAALAADAVAAGKIAADAITARELAADSVTASEISAGAVTTAKLAANAVTANEIAASTITSGQLAANSVTATQLAANSVQTAALAANAVAAGKIAADAITSRELAANSVTATEISAGSVTAAAIAAGSITTDKLTVVAGSNVLNDPSFEGSYAASVAAKFSAWTVQDLAFGNGSVASLKITTDGSSQWRAVELALLPTTAGDQLYIAADYYASADWAGSELNLHVRWETESGTILATDKSNSRATSPVKGAWTRLAGTYTAPATAVRARIRIETGLVTAGGTWFDNAVCRPLVPGVQIADGAITTPKMVANSIQGDRIAVGTLNADRIVSGSITTSQLNVTTAASVAQKMYDAGADAARWRLNGSSTTTATVPSNLTSVQVSDAQSGGYVMRAVGGVGSCWRPDVLIPFDPNVLYRVTGTFRQTVAGSDTSQQRVYMGVVGVAADGVTLVNTSGAASAGSQHYVAVAAQNLTAGSGWQRFTGYLKGYAAAGANGTSTATPSPTAPGVLHANARYISPQFYANNSGGTGTAEIGMITIEVVETGAVQTVNIADGAITTPKMVANSIQGDRIAAGTLNADRIVGQSITTTQLAALSVTANELAANAVTASKILAGSIDATHIKAGAITADRLSIVGSSNMLPDPSFEGAGGAALVAAETFWSIVNGGNGSAKSVQVNAVNATAVIRSMSLATFPILPGQQLRLATDVNPSTGWNGSSVRIYARWSDSAGNVTFGFITNTTPTKGAWSTLDGVVTAPAGTVSVEIRIASYDASAGTVMYDNAIIQPVMSQVQIADGAITAAKLDAAAINGKTITGATVQSSASGHRVVLSPDGNTYYYTGAAGEQAPGFVRVDGAARVMQLSGPQFDGIEYGVTFQNFGGSTSTTIDTAQTTVLGLFSAGNMAWGSATITPVANTDTSVTVTGVGLISAASYRVLLLANTGSPGQINGLTATGATADGFTLWINRSTATSTNVWWLMLAK